MAACSNNGLISIPVNAIGTQVPFEGDNYAHFLVSIDSWHEYLTFDFGKFLKSGVQYEVIFYVSLGENSNYCMNRLGVLFNSTKPYYNTPYRIDAKPRFTSPMGRLLCDTNNWIEIKDTIMANGDERFMTIGQFLPSDSLAIVPLPDPTLTFASYFVDGVQIIEIYNLPKVSTPNIFSPNEDGVNDQLTISIEKAQTATTQIFNRWGSLVFESTALNPVWDGTFNGQPLAEGVYFVVVQAIGSGGAQTTETQTVHLLR